MNINSVQDKNLSQACVGDLVYWICKQVHEKAYEQEIEKLKKENKNFKLDDFKLSLTDIAKKN